MEIGIRWFMLGDRNVGKKLDGASGMQICSLTQFRRYQKIAAEIWPKCLKFCGQ